MTLFWGICIDNIFLIEKYQEPNMHTLCVHYEYWKSFDQINFNICPECGDIIPSMITKERQLLNPLFHFKDDEYFYLNHKIIVDKSNDLNNSNTNIKYMINLDYVKPGKNQEIIEINNKISNIEIELKFLGINCYSGIFSEK